MDLNLYIHKKRDYNRGWKCSCEENDGLLLSVALWGMARWVQARYQLCKIYRS